LDRLAASVDEACGRLLCRGGRVHRRDPLCGVGLLEFLRYIKEEIIIVFGTITSEAVMPRRAASIGGSTTRDVCCHHAAQDGASMANVAGNFKMANA
jgi:hypothetical protein